MRIAILLACLFSQFLYSQEYILICDNTQYSDDSQGNHRVFMGSVKPDSMYWKKNDRVINMYSDSNNVLEWICIESGTPGKWHTVPLFSDMGSGVVNITTNISGFFTVTNPIGITPSISNIRPIDINYTITQLTITATTITGLIVDAITGAILPSQPKQLNYSYINFNVIKQ